MTVADAVSLHTLIGDLVASRGLADRAAAQDRLRVVLDEVNEALDPAQPLEATLGDEFQGGFTEVEQALRAGLLVRLALLPVVDSRCGVGYGEVRVHDGSRRPLLQDGPGWWAARQAVESLAGARPHRRTGFVSSAPGPDTRAVEAFLDVRDQLVAHLNDRGQRILRLALLGQSQKDIATAEDVWPSAVSQQFSRGVGAIVDAHAHLRGAERDGTS